MKKYRQAIWDEPLLVEISKQGRRGYRVPSIEPDLSTQFGNIESLIPDEMQRSEKPDLPALSEIQVLRHFIRLSQMNFAIDLGFYPLGSCTMKYNPKISDRISSASSLRHLHPYQPESSSQGILELLYRLAKMLENITGEDRVSLIPAAGAHGEYIGALIMKAYHSDREGKNNKRVEMIVPDSAHGTNPASASMAGYKVVTVESDKRGMVDIDKLRSIASERTAGIMLTVPNTLGLFEKDIVLISKMVHDAGGLLYYDGANMNALLGRVRPGDMGFDIIHLNVHKTFSTPHGGGGPGAGPIGVKRHLIPYLPTPLIDKEDKTFKLNYDLPKSVGSVKSFYGNIGVLVRVYVYLLLMGRDGLKKSSELAVLASNYLLSKLDKTFYPISHDKNILRKHEFVVSSKPLLAKGVRALDVAKKILDEGMHAPSIYFPLIVDEAIMIEPTETEPIEELDKYAEVLNRIGKESMADSESVLNSPLMTSIGRLDEYKASHPKTMKLTWRGLRAAES